MEQEDQRDSKETVSLNTLCVLEVTLKMQKLNLECDLIKPKSGSYPFQMTFQAHRCFQKTQVVETVIEVAQENVSSGLVDCSMEPSWTQGRKVISEGLFQ
jgi:hypothetical protein